MRRIARNLGSVILISTAMLTWAAAPLARTEETTAYTKAQAYNGALRFLRIEQELEVVEQDADLGYVLFQYPTGMGEERTTGSVEVIERDEDVLVVVQISKLPAHHESRLVGALLKKLEADYGAPRPKRSKEKAPPESDPPPTDDDAERDDAAEDSPKTAPRNQRTK